MSSADIASILAISPLMIYAQYTDDYGPVKHFLLGSMPRARAAGNAASVVGGVAAAGRPGSKPDGGRSLSTRKAEKAPNRVEAESLYDMPGHLIRRCHQISVALFHQECAEFGITPQQYAVLRVLADHDGVDQITLAGLAAFNRTTAGELVARLEQAGFLTREDGSEDRRVKNLFITKAGRQLIKNVHAGVRRVQERLLEPLDKTERRQFIASLARIAEVNNELSRAPLRAPRARKGTETTRSA